MKTRSASPWILGTAVLVVLILVAAWMLAAAPRMAAAASARTDTEATEQNNAIIRIKTAELAEQAANLDSIRAELDALHVGIPTHDELDVFVDQVTDVTDDAEIYIANIEAGAPEMVVEPGAVDTPPNPNAPVAEETPAPEATPGQTPAPTESPAAAPADNGAAAPVPADGAATDGTQEPDWIEGFYGIPVTITAYGDEEEIEDTVAGIQEMERLLLVTGISIIRQDPKAASGGLPAMEDGDAELKITGYVYLLVDFDLVLENGGTADQDGELPPERRREESIYLGTGQEPEDAFEDFASGDQE